MPATKAELEKEIDSLYKDLFGHRTEGINMDRAEELLKKSEQKLKDGKLGEAEVYLTKARNVSKDLYRQAKTR